MDAGSQRGRCSIRRGANLLSVKSAQNKQDASFGVLLVWAQTNSIMQSSHPTREDRAVCSGCVGTYSDDSGGPAHGLSSYAHIEVRPQSARIALAVCLRLGIPLQRKPSSRGPAKEVMRMAARAMKSCSWS